MGEDINWFIENVVEGKCVISGHSSGGIIAGWIAANYPENIEYLVLEDPPFFSVTPDEMQNSFVWLDGFKLVHDFNEQSEIDNYTEYYMFNSYFWGLFGELQPIIAEKASKYIQEHESEPLKLWYIPYKWIHGTRYLNEFDLMFAESFYDGTWIAGINQEHMLKQIKIPTRYIEANTIYGEDGVLYAANTDEDAEKVLSYIENCEMVVIESGHDIHFEKPKEFVEILNDVLDVIKRSSSSRTP